MQSERNNTRGTSVVTGQMATVVLGTCVLAQGEFLGLKGNGYASVLIGANVFTGRLVDHHHLNGIA